MKNMGTKELETKRLILRKIRQSDAKFCSPYMRDENVTRYLTWYPHENMEETISTIKAWEESYDENFYLWAIMLKENSEVVGTINAELEINTKSFMLGYALNPKYWNKGIMTESVRELLRFFFSEVEALRVYGKCVEENLASRSVMENCGMKYEGTLRNSYNLKGKIVSLSYFSILREEYFK